MVIEWKYNGRIISNVAGCDLMIDGLVQFEAEVQSLSQIRSRVICPDSDGPWIEGGMEDLMVHFTYATWTA